MWGYGYTFVLFKQGKLGLRRRCLYCVGKVKEKWGYPTRLYFVGKEKWGYTTSLYCVGKEKWGYDYQFVLCRQGEVGLRLNFCIVQVRRKWAMTTSLYFADKK